MSFWSLSLQDVPTPPAAIAIASARVSVAVAAFRGGKPVVSAFATEPLAEHALVPSLTAGNVKDRAAVRSALERALERAGRPKRVGLVVPDPVVKVTIVHFEHVPAKAAELDQLIRFQVRKSAPFSIDDAQVSYVPVARSADGQDFLVSVARRDVIQEYESVCADLGVQAGIVDIETFNVVNAVLAAERRSAADWMLVNVAPDWASVVIGRGDDLVLFRSRSADAEGTLVDLVHRTSMYYEDRLNGSGLERVLVSGSSARVQGPSSEMEELRQELEERLGAAVTPVDPRLSATMEDALVSAADRHALTPLVGLFVRDRVLTA